MTAQKTSQKNEERGPSRGVWIGGGLIVAGVAALAAYVLTRPAVEEPLYAVPLDDAPIKGPGDALVTIVEFSDFQCPYCDRAAETVKQVFEESPGDIRIAFRHAPLASHRAAALAAEATMAAHEQGKFWEYHDQLFARRAELGSGGRPLLEAIAEELDLDLERFRETLDSHRYRDLVNDDRRLLRELGRSGVPTFFINGRLLVGAQPIEVFREVIERERERARELLEKGVARDELYRELIREGTAPGEVGPA